MKGAWHSRNRPSTSVDWQLRLHQLWLAGRLHEADLIGGDGDAGQIAKLSVVQAKGPEVPGAHDAAALDRPTREIPAGVWAGIVGHINVALIQKNRQLEAADLDIFPPPLLKLVQITK